MQNVFTLLKKYQVYLVFGVCYFVGLISFTDYGLNWDDFAQRTVGLQNLDYIMNGNIEPLLANRDKFYGPVVELLLVLAEKMLGLTDIHDIYQLRHFMLFNLFFLGIIAFYRLLRTYFDTSFSLFVCVFLVLSPRIFAESFYNSKDLGFLCFLLYALYTMLQFIKYKNTKWLCIHALFSALLIDVRVMGIMIPPLTIVVYAFDVFYNKLDKKKLLQPVLYFYLLAAFVVIFFPFLWNAPLENFIAVYSRMKQYPIIGEVYFWGTHITSDKLPWYYIPAWILITTPVLYSALFFIGIFGYAYLTVKENFKSFNNALLLHCSFVLLAFPILSVIVLNSTLYDGWRHLYFIYPLFIVFTLFGLQQLFNFFASRKKLLYVLIYLNFGAVAFWMLKNHPLQNAYFNMVSRATIDAGNKFEKDYWGLSFRQGLEYLANHTNQPIHIASLHDFPCLFNLLSLDEKTRSKFIFHREVESDWEYYLTYYRNGQEPSQNLHKVTSIDIDGYPIMGIYKK